MNSNIVANIPEDIRQLLVDEMGLVVLDMNKPLLRESVLRFMDKQFMTDASTRAFMSRLVRDDSPELAERGRRLIQGVFLDRIIKTGGQILQTGLDAHRNPTPVAQSWWSYELPLDFGTATKIFWEFLTSTFFKGFRATGWKKVPYGIKLFLAAMNNVPRDEHGHEVPHLHLFNAGTVPEARKSGHASVHMLLGILASERLGVPIVGELIDERHMKPLVDVAGFKDMGQILENGPYYHGIVRWPNGQTADINMVRGIIKG